MNAARVEFSISTWQQPMPPAPSPERARVLDRLVESIDALGQHRLRVAVDDFKRPWSERHLYDRMSGEG